MLTISAVIVTWNQTELTLECLAALAPQVAPEATWVVDNGSREPALPAVWARFPGVRGLRLEQNQGFAGGCNAGASVALAGGAEALLLLNNDALAEPGAVAALAAALADDPQAGAASPKVYHHGTPRVIQSVGLRIDPDSGDVRMLGSGEPDRGQHDRRAEREGLFGCAMLIRRAAWEQVGPFWEPFFSYAEEADWCLRARRAGWRLLYVPGPAVWHRTSSTLGGGSPLKVYLIARNQLLLRRRNRRPGPRAWRGLAYALYVFGRSWARFTRRGQRAHARALELALWDAWRGRVGNRRGADLRPL